METIILLFRANLLEKGKVEIGRELAESLIIILEKEIEKQKEQQDRINNLLNLQQEKTE